MKKPIKKIEVADDHLHILIDADLKAAFIAAAATNDRKISVLVRDFAREYVKRHGGKK